MKTIIRNSIFAFVIFLTILLSACSGGGGGGGGGGGQPPADTKVGGSVVKGVIKNATVDIYAISNGQIGASPLTSVTTNSNGAYSFTLSPDFSGPVMVEVHNNASDNATMTCDNIGGCAGHAFGADMPLGTVTLKTYVQNVTGGSSQTASITPFTLMAAKLLDKQVADGQVTYNAQSIADANSQVGNLLSINNIVITTPPDITKTTSADADSNSLKYALLSAAITAIAQQDHAGDISAAITALVNSFTTTSHEGQLLNKDMADDPATISLSELMESAEMLSSYLPIEFTYGGNVTSQLSNLATIAQNSADEWTSAEPSPTGDMGDLDKVKNFVADVRTWGHVIEEEFNANTGQLQSRMDAAGTTLDIAAPLLSEAFDYAANAALEAFKTNATVVLSEYSPDPNNPVTATGEATISGDTVTVTGTANGTSINMVIDFPATLTGTEFTLTMTSATVSNSDAEIVVTQPSSMVLIFEESVDLTPIQSGGTLESIPSPVRAELDLTAEINELNVTNAVNFDGALHVVVVGSKGDENTVIRDINGEIVHINPSEASISGSISSGTNSFSVNNASATMDNADSFMPNNYWYPDIGSYSFPDGSTLYMEAQGFTRTIAYNAGQVTVTETYPWSPDPWEYVIDVPYNDLIGFLDSGDYSIQNFHTVVDVVVGYDIPLPKQASDWSLAGGSLDGILDNNFYWTNIPEENASNYRQITNVSVSFNAQLDGLPLATFTLTGGLTAFETGSLDMTIAYGNRSIHAVGDFAGDSATGLITITNQDGVVITIDLNGQGQPGSIKYDQTEYATIEQVNGVDIIWYNDGYFESF
ncbi:MAG: hypothetical protein PVJ72_06495 [Gammaproteobacteria bacterium]|jgi:hypothetical protein